MYGDERAVALQVGAVVLFAFVVINLAYFQAVAIPQQNAEVEQQHDQAVNNQLIEFSGVLTRSLTIGDAGAQQLQLGTTYPARTFGRNAPPPSGRLVRTESTQQYQLDGTPVVCGGVTPTGGFVEYRIDYNYYGESPPLVVENTIVYRDAGEAYLVRHPTFQPRANQSLVRDDDDVWLGPLQGLDRVSASGAVEITTTGGTVTETTITEETRLTVPTRLPADEWRTQTDILDESLVTAVQPGTGESVELTLAPSNTGGAATINCRPITLVSAS